MMERGRDDSSDQLVQAATFWRRTLGPTLDEATLAGHLGLTRSAIQHLLQRRALLALQPKNGPRQIPVFQFGPDHKPFMVMPEVLAAFARADIDSYTIAAWWQTEQALLNGKTPVEWLNAGLDPALVIEAAQRTATKLAW